MMTRSYRQVLLERDGQPLNQSQVQVLLRQALSQLQVYHDRQQVHGAVSLNTLHQVPHGCYLVPPTRTPTTGTPQQDVMALAQAAITLLTGYPPSPDWHWQAHCQIDAALVTLLEQMLAGRFDRAGQVLAVLVPEDLAPTEVTPMPTPMPPVAPSPTAPAVAPTTPSVSAPRVDRPTATSLPLILLGLGLGLGAVLASGGGLVWWLLWRDSEPQATRRETAATPTASAVTTPQVPVRGGGGQKVATAPASGLPETDGVQLVRSWLEAKKRVFAPPYDLDVAADFLTGPAWRDVSKPDGSVDWLRKNNTYYQYGNNRVGLKRVVKADASQLVLDLEIQEELNIYKNGRLRQRRNSRETYRFDLRLVGDTWKIYDRRSLN